MVCLRHVSNFDSVTEMFVKRHQIKSNDRKVRYLSKVRLICVYTRSCATEQTVKLSKQTNKQTTKLSEQ